jgi:hypothetical protein
MALMPTLMATASMENGSGRPGEHVTVDLSQTQDMILYEQQVCEPPVPPAPYSATASHVRACVWAGEQDTYVAERAEAMQSIERTIGELGQIFQQMAEMIQMQGEKVERIDQNIEEVVRNSPCWCDVFCQFASPLTVLCLLSQSINVEAAHSELLTYYQSISSNRTLMFKILGILLVFFILFVVVLA